MDVRICGPNLSSPAQQKGDLHVHAHNCVDLRHYGRGKRFGGDHPGFDESLVKDATVRKVVEFCYSDHIAESDDTWESYESSFWFAPCCSDMPHDEPLEGEVTHLVFECWVAGNRDTFVKYTSLTDVQDWLLRMLPNVRKHSVIKIVPHSSDEYDETTR